MGKTQNTSVMLITLTLKALCSCCSSFATWIQANNLNLNMATMGNTAFLGGCCFRIQKKNSTSKNFHSSLTLRLTALSQASISKLTTVMSLPRNQRLLWVSGGSWSPDYPGKAEWCLWCLLSNHPGKGVPCCILTSYSLGSKWTPRFLKF